MNPATITAFLTKAAGILGIVGSVCLGLKSVLATAATSGDDLTKIGMALAIGIAGFVASLLHTQGQTAKALALHQMGQPQEAKKELGLAGFATLPIIIVIAAGAVLGLLFHFKHDQTCSVASTACGIFNQIGAGGIAGAPPAVGTAIGIGGLLCPMIITDCQKATLTAADLAATVCPAALDACAKPGADAQACAVVAQACQTGAVNAVLGDALQQVGVYGQTQKALGGPSVDWRGLENKGKKLKAL